VSSKEVLVVWKMQGETGWEWGMRDEKADAELMDGTRNGGG
jgi:hypothetical protein